MTPTDKAAIEGLLKLIQPIESTDERIPDIQWIELGEAAFEAREALQRLLAGETREAVQETANDYLIVECSGDDDCVIDNARSLKEAIVRLKDIAVNGEYLNEGINVRLRNHGDQLPELSHYEICRHSVDLLLKVSEWWTCGDNSIPCPEEYSNAK